MAKISIHHQKTRFTLVSALAVVGLLPYSTAAALAPQIHPESCSPIPTLQKFVQVTRVEPLPGKQEYRLLWPIAGQEHINSQLQPESGGEFVVVRCLPPGRWGIVGKGEVENISGQFVVGRAVRAEPSHDKLLEGNLYEHPMSGDVILPRYVTTEPMARIQPKLELDMQNIFEHEGERLISYNISDEGKELLRKSFEKLRGLNGRLLVEGFMNRQGSRDVLRSETQVRAVAVARFIEREFGLRDDFVVPLGVGSVGLSGGLAPFPKWPRKQVVDGIVLRVVPR